MSSNEGGLEAVEQLQQHDHEHTTSDKRDLHKGNSVNAGHSLNLFQSTIDVGALPGTGKFLQSLLNSTSSEVSQSQMFAPGQHVVNFQRHVPAIRTGTSSLGVANIHWRITTFVPRGQPLREYGVAQAPLGYVHYYVNPGSAGNDKSTMVVAITTRYQATVGDQAAARPLLQGLAGDCLTALTLSDVPVTFTAVWFKLLLNFARRCILEHTGGEWHSLPTAVTHVFGPKTALNTLSSMTGDLLNNSGVLLEMSSSDWAMHGPWIQNLFGMGGSVLGLPNAVAQEYLCLDTCDVRYAFNVYVLVMDNIGIIPQTTILPTLDGMKGDGTKVRHWLADLVLDRAGAPRCTDHVHCSLA